MKSRLLQKIFKLQVILMIFSIYNDTLDVKRPENKHNQHRKLINFFIQAPIQIYDNSSNHMNKFYVNLNAQMTFSEKKLKNTKNIFTFFIKGPELILHRSASQIEHLTLAITVNFNIFSIISCFLLIFP